MKFHIVGSGESVEDILKGYDLSIEELKNENKHIRVWTKLIPGTKLKIPVLSENVVEDINEIEPFIEDYYPKIKIEDDVQIINQFDDDYQEKNEIEELKPQSVIEDSNTAQDNNYQETKEYHPEENKKNIYQDNKRYLGNNYRYVYLYPYFRPIIYVIPRK